MSGRVRISLIAMVATVALVALIVPLQATASSVNPASQLAGYLTLGFTPGATDIGSSGFRFYPSGTSLGTPIATQGVSVSGCTVTTPTSGTANLAKVTTNTTGGIGGNMSNGNLIGLGARPRSGSGASGTPCGRVDFGESLTITLQGTALQGYRIDEADLDIEAKFGTKVNADLKLGTQTVTSVQFTDSLPDSGPNCSGCNNWSFKIKPLDGDGNPVFFDTIILTPLVSPEGNQNNVAFSLEGGVGNPCIGSTTDCTGSTDPRRSTGLRAQLGTRQSVFHVSIPSTGTLDCSDNNTSGDITGNGIVTSVERLGNADGSDCTAVPYSLTTGENNTISFRKDLTNQPSAQFLLNVLWPAETAINPPGTEHKTKVTYDGTTYHDVLWCLPGDGAFQVWTPPTGESYCLVTHNEQLQPDGKVVVDEQLYGLGDPGLKR